MGPDDLEAFTDMTPAGITPDTDGWDCDNGFRRDAEYLVKITGGEGAEQERKVE